MRHTVAAGLAAWLAGGVAQAAYPTVAEVRAAHQPSDLVLLDHRGRPIQSVRVDGQARRLPWVRLEDVSPAMRTAIVLSEDQRFWRHSGVDWQAVAASAWANLFDARTRGASTVTMQLAGLLDSDAARPGEGRSWTQKVAQTWGARQLEAHWRKSDILEAYLNLVPFRGELVGLPALTQTLFRKHPAGLDAHEAAIAAALVRGPNASEAVVARRACQVLALQQRSCAGIELLTAQALRRKGAPMLGPQIAPHFARWALAQQGPGEPDGHSWPADARTTLDAALQRQARALLHRHLAELAGQQVEDGAVVVLDNATGAVLAWVGSSGALSAAADVDAVLARRQPGSTLKPFVYGLAFEQRVLTPASLLHDAPVQLPTGAGLYIPQNYDRRFRGWVSVRTALGNSLNVPAVRAGAMLGPDRLAQRLNDLGLALSQPGSHYGPGLALGSAEVTLLGLTNAYRALANGGHWSPVQAWRPGPATSKARPQRQVFSPAVAYLVTDILSDNAARAITFGLDSALTTRGFAAVKTGTSKDMRDNWCLGYTDRYTVGVWVGNASGAPMRRVSGVSGAAPVWAGMVRALHEERVSRPPTMPAGVVRQAIHYETAGGEGLAEPDRVEVFLQGTAQAQWQLAAGAGEGEAGVAQPGRLIRSPADGAVLALDPDIPPQSQRVHFEAARHVLAAPAGGRAQAPAWWLNGKRLGSARGPVRWLPMPGRHVLELRRGNEVLDSVRFEVRGASVLAAG
jgi:penicillin-binding protein 1C